MDLGATPVNTFFQVTLPIIAPSVISAWLLSFTLSLDDLVIASFTTGPGATTLPMKIYSQVRLGVTPGDQRHLDDPDRHCHARRIDRRVFLEALGGTRRPRAPPGVRRRRLGTLIPLTRWPDLTPPFNAKRKCSLLALDGRLGGRPWSEGEGTSRKICAWLGCKLIVRS